MRRRAVAVLAMVPVLLLGTAGCGSDGSGDGRAKTAAKKADDMKKLRDYAKCMRENGMPDFPDPNADGGIMFQSGGSGKDENKSVDLDGKMKAADSKCRHLMPNGGKPLKPDPKQLAEQRAMAKCMREHGVTDFPDPKPDGRIEIKMRRGTSMDPESKTFQNADKACNKGKRGLPPAPKGARGGAGGGTGGGNTSSGGTSGGDTSGGGTGGDGS